VCALCLGARGSCRARFAASIGKGRKSLVTLPLMEDCQSGACLGCPEPVLLEKWRFSRSHFRDDTWRARCVLAAPAARAARGSRIRRPAHSVRGVFLRPRLAPVATGWGPPAAKRERATSLPYLSTTQHLAAPSSPARAEQLLLLSAPLHGLTVGGVDASQQSAAAQPKTCAAC
jgi:hypothetical protein